MTALRYALGLLPRWLWATLGALVLAVAYAQGWRAGAEHVRAEWQADHERLRQQVDAANLRAHEAAAVYQQLKAARAARSAARRQEVNHALDAAEQWARTAVPDGVRDALAAATADAAASQPD